MSAVSSPQKKVFLLCFSLLFVKNVLFQVLVFGDLYLTNPTMAFMFYGASFATSLLLSGFVFLFKKNRWTIVLQLIVDLWIVSNMVYWRSNELFLTFDAIMMADNMSGFWGATLAYLNWKSFIFPVLTLLYGYMIWRLPAAASRQCLYFVVCIVVAYLYVPIRQSRQWAQYKDQYANTDKSAIHEFIPLFRPYQSVKAKAFASYVNNSEYAYEETYIRKQGIVDYFFAMNAFKVEYVKTSRRYTSKQDCSFAESDIKQIDSLLKYGENSWGGVANNLIFILVESFESWPVEYILADGSYLMPNLRAFIDDYPVFYADKLKSQTKMGNSGDGQMICLTGMLPLVTGAACRDYGDNVYPNFPHFYKSSVTVNPCEGAWNQETVNYSYGIQDLYEGDLLDDEVVLSKTVELSKTLDEPFFELAITFSSHTPFVKAADVNLEIEGMPDFVVKYMKCMRYFDDCFGEFIKYFISSGLIDNTDLVITGDHTIFKKMILSEVKEYIGEKNYCPLLIYSPKFTSSIVNSDVNYQMDIFPTLLGVILDGSYPWHGFGRDLLTGEGPAMDEDDALSLSDKMIRNNYFKDKL